MTAREVGLSREPPHSVQGWEFMKCSTAIQECPAYPERGRECWKVTGTKCNGGKLEMASKSEKIMFCSKCNFYRVYAQKY